jgi:hypothetical protein
MRTYGTALSPPPPDGTVTAGRRMREGSTPTVLGDELVHIDVRDIVLALRLSGRANAPAPPLVGELDRQANGLRTT